MSRFIKKKKEEIGLSPFALVFRGQKRAENMLMRAMDFNTEKLNEFEVSSMEQILKLKNQETLSWLNVDGLHDTEAMEAFAKMVDIPINIVSDILNPDLRPKFQEYDNGIFITIKMLQFNESEEKIKSENLSLIITPRLLISFQEQKGNVFSPIRERIRKHKNKIRSSGADYLAFALLDVVVDNYIYIIGLLGEKIENLEEKMTNEPRKELLDDINKYKRELNFLRKNVKPAKEMILGLAKMESDLIQDENRIHFRELQDNINEATELSDSYREILYDQLSMYHSIISTKLNEIMRVLTVFSVVFIPLTFIVGIYGTNFDYLPELHWKNGYFIMWIVMVLLAVVMLLFFKKKKWF